ncbi:hypothetical protein EVAR_86621_1 [Eumeta japonica]|uniref:RNA-directed DNA polymerase from mobile element jockey n=1 Tax=Eumeta variegata TaxID=151549 RepID=A0A4C1W3X3_EUMVA|nr:hypothetical protein EVAR_86621_1 [Eumeta japonica]
MLLLYTDNSTDLVSSRRADLVVKKLQRVFDLLPDWLDKWRVAVNVTKTVALLTGQQRIMPPKLRLREQGVKWQTRVRYLRVQIDRNMRMVAQVEHVIHQNGAARTCCTQFFECTYRSEPKLSCTRATSVLGSLTQRQHSKHCAPQHRGRGSELSRTSLYG